MHLNPAVAAGNRLPLPLALAFGGACSRLAGRVRVTLSDTASERTLRAVLHQLLAASGRASEAQLEALLARITDARLEGIVVCDRDGRMLYINEHVCRLLGRARSELAARPAAEFFGEAAARWRRADAAGERFESEVRNATGANVVVEATGGPIESGDGALVGCFGVLIDITARANALRRSETEVRLLSAQFMAAQELERQRIARELHDSISQALGGAKFGLESCAAQIAAGAKEAAGETLRQVTTRIQSVVDEVRRISMDLRPSTLDDLGIIATIAWFTREFRSVYQQLDVDVRIDVKEEEIAVPVKTAIYRIVQEAFNNVVSHSEARTLLLSLRRAAGRIELRVQDDGAGFQPGAFAAASLGRGLGLASMRERAELTGGRFSLQSSVGSGTTVIVHWPIYGKRAAPA